MADAIELLAQKASISALIGWPAGDGVVAGDDDGAVHGRSTRGGAFDRAVCDGQITALAFGASATELFVGATDHRLRRLVLGTGDERSWPTNNGTYRQLVRAHDGALLAGGWWRIDRRDSSGAPDRPAALRGISRLALDADGRRLVTTGIAAGLGLVDLTTPDRRSLPGATAVALSADGRRCTHFADGRTVTRDVDSDALVGQFAAAAPVSLHLAPNGDLVAAQHRDPGRVQVHDTGTGTLRFEVPCDGRALRGGACAFSPDGAEIAVDTGARSVRRLRCADGVVLGEIATDGDRAIALCYAHDGRSLATVVGDGTVVRVHDLVRGHARDESFASTLPTGVSMTLSAMALSPDGRRVAAGTWQGSILVRDADGSTRTIPALPGTIWSLQFAVHDPGLLVASGGAAGIFFWDLDTLECCYQTAQDVAGQVRLSDDGRTLVCMQADGAMLQDLSYRRRHVAGNLDYHLERLRGSVAIDPHRERELRRDAEAVLAAPWPRWQ